MKYIAPGYRNEKLETSDVITNSFISETTGEGENKQTTITGHLSHLLGGL
jgi:hypothetical protein